MWKVIVNFIQPVLELWNRWFKRKDEKEKKDAQYRQEIIDELKKTENLSGEALTHALDRIRSKLRR